MQQDKTPAQTALPANFNFGPYYNVQAAMQLTFDKQHVYIVGIAGGYNARGLIGTECNGIFILDDVRKAVLADELACQRGCFLETSREQQALYDKLAQLTWAEFRDYVNAQSRSRYKLLDEPVKKEKAAPLAQDVSELIRLAKGDPIHAYDAANAQRKAEFHRIGKRLLTALGKKLGVPFKVSSNLGGVAVCGEVYLHAEHLSVNLSQSALGPAHGFYYRWEPNMQGRGRSGHNKWLSWEALRSMEGCVALFKQEMEQLSPATL